MYLDVGGGSVENYTPHNLARVPLRWMIRETFKTNTGIIFDAEGLRRIGLDPDKLVQPRPPALALGQNPIPHSPSPPSSWWPQLWPFSRKTELEKCQTVFSRTTSDGTVHVDVHDEDGGLLEGTEEEEDLKDALMPIYDQLRLHWAWHILEFIPIWYRWQTKDNKWHWWFGCVGFVSSLCVEWEMLRLVLVGRWNCGRGRVIPRQTTNGVNVHRTVKLRIDSYVDSSGKRYEPVAKFKVEPNYVD
jgi:hypothetical protein